MKKALCIVGGVLSAAAVAYVAMILYVSVAIMREMPPITLDDGTSV